MFVHLIDANEKIVGQCDGHPQDWTYFTYFWQVGEIVKDNCEMILDPESSPGGYRLQTGLYFEESGERLSVIQNDNVRDEAIVILDPDFTIP